MTWICIRWYHVLHYLQIPKINSQLSLNTPSYEFIFCFNYFQNSAMSIFSWYIIPCSSLMENHINIGLKLMFNAHVVCMNTILRSLSPFFPSISLPDMLCDPSDFIWRKGTPFDAKTGRTAPSDGLLAEVFRGLRQMPGDLCTSARIISLSPPPH